MNWAVTYYRWWDIGGCARVWCILADRAEAERVAGALRHAGLVLVRVDPTSYPVEEPPQVSGPAADMPPPLKK